MCDVTSGRYRRVVLQLDSRRGDTKLIGLIDGVKEECLVTKMGHERCESLRCRSVGAG